MKTFLLLCLVGASVAWPNWQSDAGTSLAHKQQDVNGLLYKVTEHIRSKYADLKDAAEHFNPVADTSMYSDGGAAAEHIMKEINDKRVLEQHHWFSLFDTHQREEALMIFDVLMHCKDWGCFIHNAAYFREHMNEGEFIYALYVAVIHSPLADHVVLPPLYEVTPHMFTNSEIIKKAYTAKMMHTPSKFHMNFTGSKKNPEQRVAYFGEDIGMNVHHVTWHMDYPFWWNDDYGYHLDRKGELFFWVHHQLTARYDVERLSNHLNLVDEVHWDKTLDEGFAPHTTYRYGGEFPSRPDNIHFEDIDGIIRVRDLMIMESRIRDAIAHGYVIARDGKTIDIRNDHGIDVLGDIIESSKYSPNAEYYGALHNMAHIVLGRQGDPHGKFNQPPGVMEHFETATRDPSFFQLHKYMDNIFKEHKDSLPAYTHDDIDFTGVDIESVTINGKLETFFEDFDFDLTMAVDDTTGIVDVPIDATVSRLNHKPFELAVDVANNNGGNVLGTFRVFLCPRHDDHDILFSFDEGRWHCVELDKFWRTLKPGTNHVTRKSTDAATTVPDSPSFDSLIKAADDAVSSGSSLDLSKYERSCGIPNRFLVPKGTTEGMEFALIVAVTDGSHDATIDNLDKDDHSRSNAQCGIHGEKYPDSKPMGYPLDRHIPDDRVFLTTTNIAKTTVTVTHHNDH